MLERPLRICQLNTVFNGGGTDNQTMLLCSGLGAQGHAVLLALQADSKWEPVARARRLRLEVMPARGWRKGLRIVTLAGLLRRERSQIIHAHQGRDYWPAILAARLSGAGTRVVLTRHLMTRPSGLSRRALLHCADVVAVSKAVQGVLQRELRGPRQRLHQIHCGIDLSIFQPARSPEGQALRDQYGWDADAVVFGIIGRYRLPRGKGHLEFLEAAAQLAPRYPQARFAIVGRGSMGPLLGQRAAELGLQDRVAMLPFTPEMGPVLNALDVVVHPATGTDAFPLVVLEGMASGKPVIASKLDGIPEQFEDTVHGFLVPPEDVPALAQAMARLLSDPAQTARLGAAGRKHVSASFPNARQIERYEALYARLLAK